MRNSLPPKGAAPCLGRPGAAAVRRPLAHLNVLVFYAVFAAILCLLKVGDALAQSVALQGMLGNKALLIVDGTPPKAVAPGESHKEVKVISTSGDQAVLDIGGKRHTLRVGDAPASVGSKGGAGGARKITLTVGSGGHFSAQGSINGKAVQFLVDTGATAIALGTGDADRIGLNYKNGQRVRTNTANGQSVGWLVKLGSVRIAEVEVYEVDAIVLPVAMPSILLGNSFLSRFDMRQQADLLTLERRY
ncbi:MAG: retropepsin-like aspartic protease family protein [Burkholderiales bacterium]